MLKAVTEVLPIQPYLVALYQAMFVAAYFGLLQIGKITQSTHAIKAKNVHIGINKKKMMFVLFTSKTHDYSCKPRIIKIASVKNMDNGRHNTLCPFTILDHYIAVRRKHASDNEQFFVFSDCSPVKPHHFYHMLKLSISQLGLDSQLYSGHSFRIGRTIDLLHVGISVQMIKKIGRWKFNAVYRYLSAF